MTNELFFYGNATYPVVEKDGKFYADFGEKGLKLLKRNSAGELVKGFPGREPGTLNSATSNANGSHNGNSKATIAPDSGLWKRIRDIATKQFNGIPREAVCIVVTGKTVTVDIVIETVASFGLFQMPTRQQICTWSANLQEWLSGNPGNMSPSPTVQSVEGLAVIAGFAGLLDGLPSK